MLARKYGVILAGILLAALAAAGVVALPWEAAGAPIFVAIFCGGGFLLLALIDTSAEERPFVAILFLTALFIRLAAAGIFAWAANGDASLFFKDAITYDRVGWFLVQSARGMLAPGEGLGGLNWIVDNKDSFPTFVAAIYSIFGHSPASITVLNAVLGAGSVYLTYRLGSLLLGPVTARLGGWLAAFYSGFWIFSLMPLKDALFLFLVLLAFFGFYRAWNALLREAGWARRGAICFGWAVLFLAALAGVYVLRDYAAKLIAPGCALLVAVWLLRNSHGWARVLLVIAIGAATLFAIQYFAAIDLSAAKVKPDSPILDIAAIPPGGSVAELATYAIANPFDFLKFFLAVSALTLLAPFAWMPPVNPGPTIVAYFGMWMWYITLPFAILGSLSAIRRSRGDVIPLLAFSAMMFLLLALTIPGEGRHRDVIMPFLLLMAAEGIVYARRHWYWGLAVWLPLAGVMAWKLNALPVLGLGLVLLAALGAMLALIRRTRQRTRSVM